MSMTLPVDALRSHLSALQAGLLERDLAARLLLLATLAREHVLLIGPPGCGKTALVRRLRHVFAGQDLFEWRLSATTRAAELCTPGRLGSAGFAALDDVFDAPSAVLNPLLRLADDRRIDDGQGERDAPLLSLIGSARELPSDAAAEAWLDRFPLRAWLQPLSDASFVTLLQPVPAPAAAVSVPPLTVTHLQALESAAAAVSLPADVLDALRRARHALSEQGSGPSERRWQRLARLLRLMAASEGRSEVDALDLWLLPQVLADDPVQCEALQQAFDASHTRHAEAPPVWFEAAVAAFEAQCRAEQAQAAMAAAPGPERSERTIGVTAETGGLVRLRGARTLAPARRFSSRHVAVRLAQLDELAAAIEARREPLQLDLDEVGAPLAGRFWLPAEQVAAWTEGHRGVLALLDGMAARLAHCREVFAALPVDELDETPAPTPVEWPGASADAG